VQRWAPRALLVGALGVAGLSIWARNWTTFALSFVQVALVLGTLRRSGGAAV
jgi:hypothetical protein